MGRGQLVGCAACSEALIGAVDTVVEATIWCHQCERCLCADCDAQLHRKGALDPLRQPTLAHERAAVCRNGRITVLGPLLDAALLIAACAAAVAATPSLPRAGAPDEVTVQYFFDEICPAVDRVRRLIFRCDHALYPLLKGTLSSWCNSEARILCCHARTDHGGGWCLRDVRGG